MILIKSGIEATTNRSFCYCLCSQRPDENAGEIAGEGGGGCGCGCPAVLSEMCSEAAHREAP